MGGQTSRFGSECAGARVKARSYSMLVLFQPLTLDLGVAPGDALSLLPQPAYMGAALPDEKRVRILPKARMALPAVPFVGPQ